MYYKFIDTYAGGWQCMSGIEYIIVEADELWIAKDIVRIISGKNPDDRPCNCGACHENYVVEIDSSPHYLTLEERGYTIDEITLEIVSKSDYPQERTIVEFANRDNVIWITKSNMKDYINSYTLHNLQEEA